MRSREDAILCVASPIVILLLAFGGVSVGWRLTHGGFWAVPLWGWIGAGIILVASVVIWRALAARIRAGARAPAGAAGASPVQSVPALP